MKKTKKVEELITTLQSIANWELPETGEFWDKERTEPMSYGAAFGSNGERDYIKNLAQKAIDNYNKNI